MVQGSSALDRAVCILQHWVGAADALGFRKGTVLRVLEEPAAVGNGSDYYFLHKVGNYLKKPTADVTFYQIFL